MIALISIFAGIGIIAMSTILRGVTLLYLWGWFCLPLGLPGVTFWHALGISLLLHYMTYHYAEDKRPAHEQIVAVVALPLIVLLFGKLFSLGM